MIDRTEFNAADVIFVWKRTQLAAWQQQQQQFIIRLKQTQTFTLQTYYSILKKQDRYIAGK